MLIVKGQPVNCSENWLDQFINLSVSKQINIQSELGGEECGGNQNGRVSPFLLVALHKSP